MNENDIKELIKSDAWIETATCIGVRLEEDGEIVLATPRGIEDLVNLILRPTFSTEKGLKDFKRRITEKKWLEKWPKLTIDYAKKI